MIGTGGHGHTFPGATLPFAMVQLSPDTRIDGSWDGCSGYHYSDSIIYGFSHTHLSGTGCSDYGDIAFMPEIRPLDLSWGNLPNNKIELAFSHKNEISKAGYYSVKLDNGIKVELTSTLRVGIQQYTYSQNGYAHITLNLRHRDELLEGKIIQINKHAFSGLRRSKAWAENQLVYYYFEVSRDADEIIISKNENGETKVNLVYKVKSGDKILVKAALSSVDENGAKANMDKELNHWNFEKVKQDANKAWNKELNKIKVYGGTKDEKVNFYTALYHCMIHPNIMNDADGRYMGRDKQIHKADSFNYYTVFSLWDTYRALHPLLNIIDKKRSHDFIKTFQAQYEQSGRLPMWELWGNETNCMIGFHSVSVILDAYNKGVISIEELKSIYPAVKAEAMSNRFGLDKFREKGFLSVEDESESVSKTLEYSYDMSCASTIAFLTSNKDDGEYFKKLSGSWRNVYNVETGFMQPRKNGGWLEPFDPRQVNNHYTEANAWQYSFAVPHEYWRIHDRAKVSKIFNTDSKTTGREQSDITGMIGQYAQGNEPSHHIPYLFGNIDSSAKYVKKICKTYYKPTVDGLCGNEDCGQMSAWYVFSAMGFYPVNPTSDKFIFGNMLFDSVRFTNGSVSSIIYRNKKPEMHWYGEYQNSNEFIFWKESEEFYYGYEHEYLSNGSEEKIQLSSPIIESSSEVFKEKTTVTLKSNNLKNLYSYYPAKQPNGAIYYTLNLDEPTLQSYKYNDSNKIEINKNTVIKAIYITDSGIISPTSIAHFYKKPNNYSIKINSTYNPQYTADGDEGLIDGLLGETDWRKGRWQGYQGQDFEAIINLQTEKEVKNIKAGFLQDTRSWILFPISVTYWGSLDGITFNKITTLINEIPDSVLDVKRQELSHSFAPQIVRFIKIQASNYGKLPDWHQGAGGEAFIFIDEIGIE